MNHEWGQVWPPRDQFLDLAATSRVVPVVTSLLSDDTSPSSIYRRMAGQPGSFILESADLDQWSNWSFVGLSSAATLIGRDGVGTWTGNVPVGLRSTGPTLELVSEALDALASAQPEGLPPLTGGLVGALGWDIVYEWEPNLPKVAPREQDTPDVALCLVEDLIAIDHRRGVVWLVANAINHNGRPDGAEAAYDRALARIDAMARGLEKPQATSSLAMARTEEHQPSMRVSQDDFESAVETAKHHIRMGDIFQVVLSQRADMEATCDPLEVYRVLRSMNPSPYMYFLMLDDGLGGHFHVVGSSPETLMAVRDGRATTFPIAGSRPRGADPHEDRELEAELLKDPKEVSEHVMLVDLARNDLSKVCVPGTVEVSGYMDIKRFSHIMHICSTVEGRLEEGVSAVDCLKATFPAGTLSGAPKPKAIEIIDRLEPARRGIYGGVVGYMDFSGNADLAIAIRTAVIHNGVAHVQSGAGIVADSVPTTEFVETKNKAAASLRSLSIAARLGAMNEVKGSQRP